MPAYLVHIPILIFGIYFLKKRFSESPIHAYFLPGILLRIVCGLGFGLLYLHYYTAGDTWSYFDDAVKLADTARADFAGYSNVLFTGKLTDVSIEGLNYAAQPRAFLFVRLLSILALITFGNYWISGIYLSIIAFLGMWFLAHTLAVRYPQVKHAAALGFLFFPSAVFFSSGVSKESVAAGLIGLLCALVLRFSELLKRPLASHLGKVWRVGIIATMTLLAAGLLWNLKYYYFAALIPILAAFFLVELVHKAVHLSVVKKSVLFLVIVLGSAIAVVQFHPNLWASRIAEAIVINHDGIIAASGEGAVLIYFNNLSTDFIGFLSNIPLAAASGLYGPFIWNTNSLFQFFAGTEGLVLIAGTAWALYALIRRKYRNIEFETVAAVIYILIPVTILALAVPNYGSLIRYKAMFTPFLAFLLLIPVLGGRKN